MADTCMNTGQILNADEMESMGEQEMDLENELEDFEHCCLGNDLLDTDNNGHRDDHYKHMRDLLDRQYQFCNQMMEDHHWKNADRGNMCDQTDGTMGMQ